ncbi:MAG TPA: AAA family ATPase [Longimicrobiaceae bacterium]|nr:AAA family ATPase [Longimicrobiaceae bacterium]
MRKLPFVGRELEVRQILAVLERGVAGHGSVVFVEGSAGIGKSVLIRKLIEKLLCTPDLKDAVVAYGHCYEETGPQNAYQPFVEILGSIANSPARRDLRDVLGAAFKKTAPDWLQAIPMIGPLLGAGAKTASLATELWGAGATPDTRLDSMARQYLEAITGIGRDRPLMVLVLEDVHWIDHASCELLLRLSSVLAGSRIVVVLAHRPLQSADRSHPLSKARSELIVRGCAEVTQLGGLTEPQIAEYLRERFGGSFSGDFPRWLLHLCNGHPLFISQYLNLLEQEGIIYRRDEQFQIDGGVVDHDGEWEVTGRLADQPVSSDIDTLLDYRIERLMDEEREMLQIGAVQGEHFGSLILAEIFQKKELTILAQLRRVAERHRIISLYSGHDWLRDKSEVYAFEHFLMYQAFYRKLSPRERLLYHREIAGVLRKLAGEYSSPPRRLLLDIAHHCKKGQQYFDAASYYYTAAESSYFDGATVEAAHLCQEALTSLNLLSEGGTARERMIADCTLLHLVCTLYGPIDRAENLGLLSLAREGEAAAERAESRSTLAQIKALMGHLYIRLGRVKEAIAEMREAVEIAQETNDPITEFFALVQLGKQLAKDDLGESMVVRYRAREVFDEHVATADLGPEQHARLSRQFSVLLLYIGLGEFDRGDFEKGIEYLEQGVRDLRKHHMYDDLLAGLNYLGQVHANIGLFQRAEQYVRETVELQSRYDPDTLHPWIGYNLALLGKIHLEWGHPERAVEFMREGVRISEETQQADLLTLVRNYQAELLMCDANPEADLHEAERVLIRNLEESQDGGMHRSAAFSLSLLGLLKLKQGIPGEAFAYSSRAVGYIDIHGNMPTLRMEEVLYNHHRVLWALGREQEAMSFLERAHDVLQQKGRRIRNPAYRDSFFEGVPLSRSILDAYRRRPAAAAKDTSDGT